MTVIRAGAAWLLLAAVLEAGGGAQAPRPDRIGAEKHHRTAVEYFDKAQKDATLTAEQKRDALVKGIAAESRALASDPDHIVSLVYKNILLRMQAVDAGDEERAALIRQADALGQRVQALQAGHPERGFLQMGGARDVSASMPADFKALVDELHPLPVGGKIKTPARARDAPTVYPPIAQVVRIEGVVIVEVLIGVDGHVRAARVLRSIPLLDEAALACVRQTRFMPTVVNGAPVPVLLTMHRVFVLQ